MYYINLYSIMKIRYSLLMLAALSLSACQSSEGDDPKSGDSRADIVNPGVDGSATTAEEGVEVPDFVFNPSNVDPTASSALADGTYQGAFELSRCDYYSLTGGVFTQVQAEDFLPRAPKAVPDYLCFLDGKVYFSDMQYAVPVGATYDWSIICDAWGRYLEGNPEAKALMLVSDYSYDAAGGVLTLQGCYSTMFAQKVQLQSLDGSLMRISSIVDDSTIDICDSYSAKCEATPSSTDGWEVFATFDAMARYMCTVLESAFPDDEALQVQIRVLREQTSGVHDARI